MKKLFCCLFLLFLTGCHAEKTPQRPVMRFENTPVTLTATEFDLQGKLTFAGVDGIQWVLESPEPVRGFVLILAQGELHIARDDVRLSMESTGSAAEFLQAVRAFDLEAAEYTNGVWQLAGTEVFLTADENGRPVRLWSDGWQAIFKEKQ